jgi:hypothetical protein
VDADARAVVTGVGRSRQPSRGCRVKRGQGVDAAAVRSCTEPGSAS